MAPTSRTRARPNPAAAPFTPATAATPRDRFSQAVRSHVAGDHAAAEAGYRAVLAAEPSFAEAANNLGVLLRGRDDQEAHALFEQAVAANPQYLEGRFNFALSCLHRGELRAAVEAYRAVLALSPDNARALSDLSSCLRGLGEFDEAMMAARRAVELLPNDCVTQNNLGNILLETGHLDDAVACYERALAIWPEYPEAMNNLGTTYRAMRRPEQAVPLFIRALDLKPGYIDAMHNLALALPPGMSGGDEIEARLRAEVARMPESAAALGVLAVFLQEAGRFDEARVIAADVVRRDETNADAWTVLGICAAEAVDPREAIRCYDRAFALDSRLAVARWNRAIALLALGEYEEGWREYESRWSLVNMAFDRRVSDRAEWNGTPLDGRTILVYTEQGLGDAIQFARFGAELKQRWNARVIVECDGSLVSLFRTCDWVDDVVARGQDRPPFDEHVALLSLPRIFGTTLDRIPTAPAFRFADRAIARQIRKRGGELHVGLVWGGRAPNATLARRSVPLEMLAPIASIPGVRLHSLQVGDVSGQLSRCSFRNSVQDLAPHIGDFVDTAAAMRELDLVITIDTSVAHLAGAFGVPVWVMLMRNADWRWLIDRDDSPWYPSARLFRQRTAGDWQPVVDEIASRLRELVGDAPPATAGSQAVATELPSLQRDAGGAPRFSVSIPLDQLADDAAFRDYSIELAGDGLDAEARNFIDAESRPSDLVIDIGGRWGITALGAATAPQRPAQVVAIVSDDAQARIVESAASGGGRIAPVSVIVGGAETRIDPIIESLASRASRAIVRIHRAGDVLPVLAGAAGSLTRGAVAAIIWNLAGAPGDAVAWNDQLVVDALSSLGFEHFTMLEDDGGPMLDALDASPASRVVFSLVVSRFQSETTAAPGDAPVVGMDWQIGATSGWGVYGLNLVRRLLATERALPAPMLAPSLDGVEAAVRESLAPALTAHVELASAIADSDGRMIDAPFAMLRALGNGLAISPHSAAVNAARNIGVVFFESTELDKAAIERAKRFDRIVAGSTWNEQVLRAHGVEHVVTVLQGVNAGAFAGRTPRPRQHGRFVVFSGGKLEYRKGQDIVVAAFREFVQRHPEAKLMVAWHNHWPQTMCEIGTAGHVSGVPAANGYGQIDLTGWLERNGIPRDAVIDLGLRSNDEMAELIGEADVALFTNRAEGGTNLVAMECLAAAVPTILSANTGHLDLIDDSRCFALRRQGRAAPTPSFRGTGGWGETDVAEAVAALEQVYANPREAADRARRAAEWMQGLSWDAQIDRLFDAIRDLL